MGIIKEVEIKGRKIQVRTLSFADVIRIRSSPNANIILESLRVEDKLYLEELDHDKELEEAYTRLISTFLEVNPVLKAENKEVPLEKKNSTGGS